MTKKNVFIFITVLLIILICSMSLYAKETVLFDDNFEMEYPPYGEGNALGWSYSIENEDVESPNEIYHDRNTQCIRVEMKNAAELGEFGNQWFTEVRYQGITLKAGVEYTLTAFISADADTKVQMKLDKMAAPYNGSECPRNYSDPSKDSMRQYDLIKYEGKEISFKFTPEKDYYGVKFALLFDGALVTHPEELPFDIKIYSASLIAEAPNDVEVPVPNFLDNGEAQVIKVNHLGYLPKSKKIAYYSMQVIWISPTHREPKPFTLYDSEDNPVYTGLTQDMGSRHELISRGTAANYNHIMDFSDFQEPGTGYYLKIDDTDYVSQPFDISNDIYQGLADDALSYFYYNRSGIEITLGDESQHRPAGHPGDEAAYQGKTYDVEGGWYDAGDFGKYTVTGAYSIWMLLNLYEQYGYEVNGLIPEDVDGENGINDLLDEAKYELEFLFKMQVPEEGLNNGGGMFAGGVFHKMHDETWTSLPCMPYDDDVWYEEKDRILYIPTFTATLDFTAVMAQAWRIWRDLDDNDTGEDDEFAIKCRDAALAAYHSISYSFPDIILWTSNRKIDNGGGGPYDDVDYRDELYWALIELYISSGDPTYIESFDFTNLNVDTEGDYYGFKEIRINQAGDEDGVADLPHSWKNVSGCGVLSLYAAKDKVDNPEMISDIESAIVALSNVMHEKVIDNPFGFAINQKSEIFWGSNQTITNRALLMSCAYEITNDEKYLEGVSRAMDYLLGTNPLDISYITGYGERAAKNPHHRFWAGIIDPRYPKVPKGCLVGGSNPTQYNIYQNNYKDEINLKSHDPFVILGKIYKIDYLKAYVDSYEAYSTNEVTINWNAALVCLAACVDNLDIYKDIDIEGLLDNIETSEMVLTPEFEDDIFNYTATVDNEVDSFSLTPTAIDDDTLIYVNGVLVESGQPSQEIDLNVGDNTITIFVESAGGDSVTYTINITREEADYILLTDRNVDKRNYRVNDELTFKILTGGSGVIQIDSVVPWPSQVTVSINGGPYQPTPQQWGGPFYVPANTFVIFKVKAAVPTDIVLNWW